MLGPIRGARGVHPCGAVRVGAHKRFLPQALAFGAATVDPRRHDEFFEKLLALHLVLRRHRDDRLSLRGGALETEGRIALGRIPDAPLEVGHVTADQGARVLGECVPGRGVGAEDRNAPGDRHGMHMARYLGQTGFEPRQGAGDRAIGHAVADGARHLGEGNDDGDSAEPREHLGLRNCRHADPAAPQILQRGEGLGAEHDLRRIGVDGEQFDVVALANDGLHARPHEGDVSLQGREVRIEPREVRNAQHRLIGRRHGHERRAKRQHAEAHQLQHVLAAQSAAIEGMHDRGDATLGELRDLARPEWLLERDVLLHAGKAADDPQFDRFGTGRPRRAMQHAEGRDGSSQKRCKAA